MENESESETTRIKFNSRQLSLRDQSMIIDKRKKKKKFKLQVSEFSSTQMTLSKDMRIFLIRLLSCLSYL